MALFLTRLYTDFTLHCRGLYIASLYCRCFGDAGGAGRKFQALKKCAASRIKNESEMKTYVKRRRRNHEQYIRGNIWIARWSGSVHFRNEYDERLPSEGSRRKNETDSGIAYQESNPWRSGRSTDNRRSAEQQCDNRYGDRFCKCRTDESAAGNLHHPRSQYRNDDDGTDHCL